MTTAEKLTAIAEGEQQVFDAGKASKERAFWDMYQNKGARKRYDYAFSGYGWTKDTFKPKYNIIAPSSAYGMFRNSQISGDLVELLGKLGVSLDFSGGSDLQQIFYGTLFERVGVVDVSGTASTASSLFANSSKLHTIDKVIFASSGATVFTGTFANCSALENITVEGVIGNSMDVHWSTKLTHDSLMSIIAALQTKSSGSFVLTLGTTNLGKLTDAEKAIATERGWTLA